MAVKIGVLITTNDPESAWNAFRYCISAVQGGHAVRVYLLGKGVECEGITDAKFNVKEKMNEFATKGGTIGACEACLEFRSKGATELCPITHMKDLVDITVDSDKMISFG